ncbi:hypothetical protein ACEPPN_008724 [Leptodophora sp. 'Broadleaf-Isolate-01']
MDSTNSDPRRNCPTLLDVLGQYGIFDMLCRRLDTATLFSLRLVTKRLANHFAAHAKERWNFNRRLKHFVRNPQSLRTLMARYNALISGSFVIQFFDDSFWKESDLDIYVERESAAAFGTHLCQKEGYRFDRGSTEDDDYDFLGFVQVDTYLRGDKLRSNETKIQVISTGAVPVRSILGCFSTTAAINFMSWNTAYSMFPAMTFLEPRSQCRVCWVPDNEDRIQSLIEKYSKRGWKAEQMQFAGFRRVGDSRSWKIVLDIARVEPSSTPDYVLENCHFNVVPPIGFPIGPIGPIEDLRQALSFEFTSDVLKYKYTGGEHSTGDFWSEMFMKATLHGLLLDELRKLDHEAQPHFLARPTQWSDFDRRMYLSVHVFMRRSFVKPDSWRYYDDQVPTWLKEWEEEKNMRELNDQMATVAIT